MVKQAMNLNEWLPTEDKDFFGLKVSEDEKKGWREGRDSLRGWWTQLTLWERLKFAWSGKLGNEYRL